MVMKRTPPRCHCSSDYKLGEQVNDILDRKRLFVSVRSAAESGWDFSSKEMRPGLRTQNASKLKV